MTDELLNELLAVFFAARADGNGVLTIEAMRIRLEAAGIRVERVGR
jgi:hypothetical protein